MAPEDESLGELLPRPDPTRLTTEALMREISRVDKQFTAALDNLLEFHKLDLQRIEQVLTEKQNIGMNIVHGLREVYDEKLTAVQLQFDLIERQRVELRANTGKALDAALAANKDSLESLGHTYNTSHVALVALVDDIKSRVTALEAMRMGSKETNAGLYAVMGVILTIVWIAITILALYGK